MVLMLERQPKEFYTALEEYVIKKAKELKDSKQWFLVDEAKYYDDKKKVWIDIPVNKWIKEYGEGRRIDAEKIYVKKVPGELPGYTVEYLRAESYKRWLIVIGEYDNFLMSLEESWLSKHEKFVDFCLDIKPRIVELIRNSKTKKEVFISIDNMIKELDDYHATHPKAMNIYSKNDLIFGLYSCLGKSKPKIDVRLSNDERHLIFTMKI